MKNIFILILSFICSQSVFASDLLEFELFTALNPPYVSTFTYPLTKSEGIAIELISKLEELYPDKIVIKSQGLLPWKRAQKDASETENSLLIPLTRTIKREPFYQWVDVAYTDNYSIYISGDNNKKITLQNLKTAPKSSIGVFAGGGVYNMLLDLGVKNESLYQIRSEDTNLKMITSNRILYWGVQDRKFNSIVKDELHKNELKPKKALSLGNGDLWIVTSPKTSKNKVIQLRNLFTEFKKTKAYNDIIDKYK